MEARQSATLWSDEQHRSRDAFSIPWQSPYLRAVCQLSALSRMYGRCGQVSAAPEDDVRATPGTVSAGAGAGVHAPRSLSLAQTERNAATHQTQSKRRRLHRAAFLSLALWNGPNRGGRKSP